MYSSHSFYIEILYSFVFLWNERTVQFVSPWNTKQKIKLYSVHIHIRLLIKVYICGVYALEAYVSYLFSINENNTYRLFFVTYNEWSLKD